jgi:XTP/dITP diphosphohydrolase
VTVYCATSNSGKLREFRMAASEVCQIEPLPGMAALTPPDETGSTFEENAVLKALAYGAHTDGWLFAEDSGLEVDALGGEPGVYSARYSPEGTDEANNRLVLQRLGDSGDRTGRFVCVIALVRAGELVRTFRGTVEGEILGEPRGPHGFGYDPIFYYPPFGCSFGEAERERKQTVSHRGAALRQLVDYFRTTATASTPNDASGD